MNMKMTKPDMIKAILTVAAEGIKLAEKRKGVISSCMRMFLEKSKLREDTNNIMSDSDSFPNFWYGTENNLKQEKKQELIKIYELYIRGIKTLEWANTELEALLLKNSIPEPIEENKCGHCGEPMEDGSHCTESEQYKGICVECVYHNFIDYDHDDDYPDVYETWVGDQE